MRSKWTCGHVPIGPSFTYAPRRGQSIPNFRTGERGTVSERVHTVPASVHVLADPT